MCALSEPDRRLIESAREVIRGRYKPKWHGVGAALRTRSGREFAAVNIEAEVGRLGVCAEAVAIGMAATAGDTEIATIVAVAAAGQVVSPCGMCRELIADYAPDAKVIVPGPDGHEIALITDLLPNKTCF